MDEELNKAAEEYAGLYFDRQTEYKSFWHDVDTFKAVAEWMKKQMMEEAVDGVIVGDIGSQEDEPHDIYVESMSLPLNGKWKMGDKVKIVILPNKEEK